MENVGDSSALLGENPALAAHAVRPRVFIVSDMRLLCDGLTLSLSQQSAVTVVGSADLSTAPVRTAELRPDVLLLDVGTRGGLDAALKFRQVLPNLKVVAMAVVDVPQEVFACAEAGVSGFVSRNGSIQDLVSAVHCAVRDELVCSPRTAALLLSRVATLASKGIVDREIDALTRREKEIVCLVTEGLSNKEIARQLRIQNTTVKNHVHSILSKLQVRRRGEVAARMRADGGIQPMQDAHRHGSITVESCRGPRSKELDPELRLRGANGRSRGLALQAPSQ
jgi:two-component system nitrate/nitrite response regulator NarL